VIGDTWRFCKFLNELSVRAREPSQRARHDAGEYPTARGSFSPGKQCAPNESFTSSSSSTVHTGILFTLWWSPALTLAIAHYFLLARRYASAVQDGPVCLSVCLSVTSPGSIETAGRIELGFGTGASFDCVKRKFRYLQK